MTRLNRCEIIYVALVSLFLIAAAALSIRTVLWLFCWITGFTMLQAVSCLFIGGWVVTKKLTPRARALVV